MFFLKTYIHIYSKQKQNKTKKLKKKMKVFIWIFQKHQPTCFTYVVLSVGRNLAVHHSLPSDALRLFHLYLLFIFIISLIFFIFIILPNNKGSQDFLRAVNRLNISMILLTIIARVSDGLPLAASVQVRKTHKIRIIQITDSQLSGS